MLKLSDHEVDLVVEKIRFKLLASVRQGNAQGRKDEKKEGGETTAGVPSCDQIIGAA